MPCPGALEPSGTGGLPDYLARHGRPRTPEELQQHACLLYLQLGRVYDKWRLGSRTVQVRGPLFSDDADVVRRWALEGEGIVYKSWLDVSANVAAGELEILMPEHPGEPTPVTLVCPTASNCRLRFRSCICGYASASRRCSPTTLDAISLLSTVCFAAGFKSACVYLPNAWRNRAVLAAASTSPTTATLPPTTPMYATSSWLLTILPSRAPPPMPML